MESDDELPVKLESAAPVEDVLAEDVAVPAPEEASEQTSEADVVTEVSDEEEKKD